MERRWRLGVGAVVVAVGVWLWSDRNDDRIADERTSDGVVGIAHGAVPASGRAAPGRGVAAPVPRGRLGATAQPSVDPERPASPCATLERDDCPFVEPDADTVDEMARCGIVRYEIPRFLDRLDDAVPFDDEWFTEAGVTTDERDALTTAAAAFRERTLARVSALAVEVGLDQGWAEQTPVLVGLGMVQAELDPQDHADALHRLARERAGLLEPPTSPNEAPVADRAARLLAGLGSEFEDALASAVGPVRAAELRTQRDGWPGVTRSMGNRCDVPPPSESPKAELRTRAEAAACVENWPDAECRFTESSPLLLSAMAKCGVVRFDFPTFLMTREAEPVFEEPWAVATRLTPSEVAVLAEVGDAVRDALYEDITTLAVEIGKTRAWAEATPLMGLMMALSEEVDDDAEIEAVFRKVAEERAAGVVSPALAQDTSVHERFIRRVVDLGPTFEAAVARRLGAVRAHELRRHADGWPSTRVQSARHCP